MDLACTRPAYTTVLRGNRVSNQKSSGSDAETSPPVYRISYELIQISPFLVQKSISATVGEVASVKKMRSGDLLVEVSTRNQAQNIQKVKALATIPVNISPHTSLNTSQGVITCGEIFNLPLDYIQEELKPQGVIKVRRITIRREGQILETKHHIITFKSPKLPDFIYAGYIKLPVRPYIPNPLRCFKCQRFGHSKANCRGTVTCARCSEKGHESQQCSAPEKFVNCKGEHTSFSRLCPRWKLEKQITTTKIKEEISYSEARKKVLLQTPLPGVSYASVVQKNCCENCTKKTSPREVSQPMPVANFSSSTIKSKLDDKMDEANSMLETMFTDKPNQNTDSEIESDNAIVYNPHETIDETPPAPEHSTDSTTVDKTVFRQSLQKSMVEWVDPKKFYSQPSNTPIHKKYLKKHRIKRLQ
ncbi:uncharacterized protein LOC129987499 [Argiope bruennichi]|uniref:uncharacterized protein LOC129987499 n=1 Tax=Argiope bruennichi TaxID=94029 RepID=UPI0024950439|nr:uncharacterized protein LOC129987499 [Argiope bruennichi]